MFLFAGWKYPEHNYEYLVQTGRWPLISLSVSFLVLAVKLQENKNLFLITNLHL